MEKSAPTRFSYRWLKEEIRDLKKRAHVIKENKIQKLEEDLRALLGDHSLVINKAKDKLCIRSSSRSISVWLFIPSCKEGYFISEDFTMARFSASTFEFDKRFPKSEVALIKSWMERKPEIERCYKRYLDSLEVE